MPDTELLDLIRKKAEHDLAGIGESALIEADALIEEAERTSEKLKTEALSRINAEASHLRERKYNSVRFRMNAKRYELKATAIESAWREAEQALASLERSQDYPAILTALFKENLSDAPDNSLVRVNPADEPLVRGLIDESGRPLPLETDGDIHGGIEILWPDGAIVLRNTLSHRLAKLKAGGNAFIADILFGDIEEKPS